MYVSSYVRSMFYTKAVCFEPFLQSLSCTDCLLMCTGFDSVVDTIILRGMIFLVLFVASNMFFLSFLSLSLKTNVHFNLIPYDLL